MQSMAGGDEPQGAALIMIQCSLQQSKSLIWLCCEVIIPQDIYIGKLYHIEKNSHKYIYQHLQAKKKLLQSNQQQLFKMWLSI